MLVVIRNFESFQMRKFNFVISEFWFSDRCKRHIFVQLHKLPQKKRKVYFLWKRQQNQNNCVYMNSSRYMNTMLNTQIQPKEIANESNLIFRLIILSNENRKKSLNCLRIID